MRSVAPTGRIRLHKNRAAGSALPAVDETSQGAKPPAGRRRRRCGGDSIDLRRLPRDESASRESGEENDTRFLACHREER